MDEDKARTIAETSDLVLSGLWNVCRWIGFGQGENGIISNLDMSGEMHMRRRSEVFGCIPHGHGALS